MDGSGDGRRVQVYWIFNFFLKRVLVQEWYKLVHIINRPKIFWWWNQKLSHIVFVAILNRRHIFTFFLATFLCFSIFFCNDGLCKKVVGGFHFTSHISSSVFKPINFYLLLHSSLSSFMILIQFPPCMVDIKIFLRV